MPDDLITLDLTRDQAQFLSDVLWDHKDCGPVGEGWASDALNELRDLIDEKLR